MFAFLCSISLEDGIASTVDWRAPSGSIIPAPSPPELIPYEAGLIRNRDMFRVRSNGLRHLRSEMLCHCFHVALWNTCETFCRSPVEGAAF